MNRILKTARTDIDRAIDVLIQEKKVGLKEMYLAINQARKENDLKLYHQLLRGGNSGRHSSKVKIFQRKL